jgi:hypothetical protein
MHDYMHQRDGADYEALARQELTSVLHIFEYWTDGNQCLRALLETQRDDKEAFSRAKRRLQQAISVLEPRVSVRAKHVYAPYCIAVAGSELATRTITERGFAYICGLTDYARLLHRRALEDTGHI